MLQAFITIIWLFLCFNIIILYQFYLLFLNFKYYNIILKKNINIIQNHNNITFFLTSFGIFL